jgi:hypothetical protein
MYKIGLTNSSWGTYRRVGALERMTWWVIGTENEAERQELRAGIVLVSPDRFVQPEFLPGAGDWKGRRNVLPCNAWLGQLSYF